MQTETTKRPPKPKKVETIQALTDKVARARGIYFTDFRGLTVAEMTDLRRQCFQNHVDYVVCKNTFSRRVLKEKGYDGVLNLLEGPTALAFGYQDGTVPAKILWDYSAKNEKLVIKGALLEGSVILAKDVKAIKDLPSRDVALAMVIGALFSPVQGFHGVISGVLRDFVSVIDQIIEQKKAA
ncbi:MAG: 50S ribosomal protein L10 [bacterium]|nr:50S ribosomal protein L10 [bacterium]